MFVKPEWFFNHILTLIEDYTPIATTYIQLFLDEHLPDSGRDAVLELISAILPMLRRRIRNLLPQIVKHAQLLSHFIHEMIKFDIILRDEYLYAPYGTHADAIWKGITHEVLVKDDWFWQWLKVEKDCKYVKELGCKILTLQIVALSRYQNIINANDAWQIDDDSVEANEAKPTRSAIRLKDLLEAITGNTRTVLYINYQQDTKSAVITRSLSSSNLRHPTPAVSYRYPDQYSRSISREAQCFD